MSNRRHSISRRGFLATAPAACVPYSDSKAEEPVPHVRTLPGRRVKPSAKKLAVITTAYYYLSHAYHICGRFLDGYLRNGEMAFPEGGLASMYVEQRGRGDLSGSAARKHGVPLYPRIEEALTLGGKSLAVDGVLLIGEHGDYPYNAKGQKLYPRFEYFQEIVRVFERSGRTVPVFCDKHLSYDRSKAGQMVETARKMGFPLYAGSSLPITWRSPELELPLDCSIESALVASRGELEIYGIHALEALQCMVERRHTTRQGVRSVTCFEGDAVWKAGDDKIWSWELLEHALGRSPSLNVGDIRENCKNYVPAIDRPTTRIGPIAFVVEYLDGLRATALLLNGHNDDTTFAAKICGQPKPASTLFHLPPPPGAGFLQSLALKVDQFMLTGVAPYPVERTQLTGGILDHCLESRVRGFESRATPDLDIQYRPPADSGFSKGEYSQPV